MRDLVLFTGEPYAFQPWGELLHSVRTGQTAFDHFHGMSFFDYCARHPEQGKVFDAAMTGSAGPEIAAVMADYDFSGIGTLVDLGGGHGSFLGTILKFRRCGRALPRHFQPFGADHGSSDRC